MKIKKLLVGMLAVSVAAITAACSNNSNSEGTMTKSGYMPKELNVEFVPSVQANKMEAKAKPLEGLLKKQLGIPVHVTVSTDYNGLVEAMASKKVDVALCHQMLMFWLTRRRLLMFCFNLNVTVTLNQAVS